MTIDTLLRWPEACQLMQVEELDESNNELEDTNTRLEGRALDAEEQVTLLTQQLAEAMAQVLTVAPCAGGCDGCCDPW